MNTNNKPSTAGRTTADDILQRDARFRYMLLARMQSDCEYYLDYGGRDPKRLWAGDEERQIDLSTFYLLYITNHECIPHSSS